MKIARLLTAGRAVIGIDRGQGFVDYGAILDLRGYGVEGKRGNEDHLLLKFLKNGFFETDFLLEQLDWASHSGHDFSIAQEGLIPLMTHRPTKIICVARNYREHAKEGGAEVPESPVFFAKTDNCALAPGMPIRIPMHLGRVDHEGELAVVISRSAERIKASEADKYILGYTVLNDVTAREFQKRLAARGLPWFQAKSRDTFAPFGPHIVTPDELPDLNGRTIKVWVNKALRQDGNTNDMVWKVPELLEEITSAVTLFPGDIVATGTPSGVGGIMPGDEVVVEVEGVGRLVNPVEAE